MEPSEKPKAEKSRRPRRRPGKPRLAKGKKANAQSVTQTAPTPAKKKHPKAEKKFTANIVLCGFMGCGKSSVGRRVAKLLGRQFCDLDNYIEKKAGMTVTEIFQKEGETGFRDRETQAAEETASQQGMVIACGGGTVLSQRNVDAFHKYGAKILFLDVPVAALQERLKNDKRRPLLQVPDRRKVIAELYEKRCPLYQAAADITIDGGAPAVVVAKRIAKYFQ